MKKQPDLTQEVHYQGNILKLDTIKLTVCPLENSYGMNGFRDCFKTNWRTLLNNAKYENITENMLNFTTSSANKPKKIILYLKKDPFWLMCVLGFDDKLIKWTLFASCSLTQAL